MQRFCGGTTEFGLGREDRSALWRAPSHQRPLRVSKARICPLSAQLVHPKCCSVTRTDTEREALLCSRFVGHEAPVLSMLVKTDEDGKKELITSSLDKSLALWHLQDVDEAEDQLGVSNVLLGCRIQPTGAPIFSLAEGLGYYARPIDQGSKSKAGSSNKQKQVFCGNADNTVAAWIPPSMEANPNQPPLTGHDGWVRALATYTTPNACVLFSAACNRIHMWRMDVPTIKQLLTVKTPKEDVLALAVSGSSIDPSKGRLFTGGNDGTIRVYAFRLQKSPMPSPVASKKTTGSKDGNGNGPVARVEGQRATLVEEEVGGRKGVRAHMDRISAMVYHKNFLYTVSRDGSIRMWDTTSMTLVAEVKQAHGGKPISCVVIGPDNFLYTGGNDNFVRRWTLGELAAARNHELYGHNYPVRSLAAGECETLVSADAGGEIAVWRL